MQQITLYLSLLEIPATQVNAQEEAPEFIFSFSTQFPGEELENLREGVCRGNRR